MRLRIAGLAGLVAILGAAPSVTGFRQDHATPVGTAAVISFSAGPAPDPIRADEIVTVLPVGAKTALIQPSYLSVAQAGDIRPDEEVIGVAFNGDARAFPLATLNVHEIVDDAIGGEPVAVTW